MPHVSLNGVKIHYTDSGGDGETIVFSHGLLFSGAMFEAQVAALRAGYRCITFDHRGQGGSDVTEDGYDMDTLTEDAAGLIRALDAGPCHFVGLSMGGFVGMRLAVRHAGLIRSLTLIETSADAEPADNVPRYGKLNFVARWIGLWAVIGRVMPIMFGQSFLSDPDRADERARWRKAILSNHRIGITRAVNGVIARDAFEAELSGITQPVLIIVGDEDVATVPAKSERMHAAIAGSRLVVIEGAGHSSTIERPEAVNEALTSFIAGLQTGA
ncbi:alpha/beta hydrolase [Roseovarius sp. CAU 1744]|uniref:alpha/beta fold hydrolase n=1 Tax=Roseovarius sp. CAU 1744 TaxID=3140368 RepID=UPI00325C0697